MKPRKTPTELRSYRWFGPDTMRGMGHRSRMKQVGYRREDFTGKPVIAIVNTWSEINPCHTHLRERAETVKRGVWQAGGFPVEIPAFSITETYMKPSPMLYRNLLAMETEEFLRRLELLVSPAELEKRRSAWTRSPSKYERGYMALYAERVTQAHQGWDFDFLERNIPSPEPDIH